VAKIGRTRDNSRPGQECSIEITIMIFADPPSPPTWTADRARPFLFALFGHAANEPGQARHAVDGRWNHRPGLNPPDLRGRLAQHRDRAAGSAPSFQAGS
jgi:hypothetical protein